MGLTVRVERRIAEDFPGRDGEVVGDLLTELVNHLTDRGDREDKERIAAATLLCGQGRVDRLLDAVQLAKEDWRGRVVGGGAGGGGAGGRRVEGAVGGGLRAGGRLRLIHGCGPHRGCRTLVSTWRWGSL